MLAEFPKTKARVKWFTENEEGIDEMSTLFEKYFGEEYTIGMNKVRNEIYEEEKKTLNDLVNYIQENCTKEELLAQIEDKIKEIAELQRSINCGKSTLENA